MPVQQRGGNALPDTLAERELFVHVPAGEGPKIFTGPTGGGAPVPVSGGGVTANYLLNVRVATPDMGPGDIRPIEYGGGTVSASGATITTINTVAATGYDSAVFDVATTAWTDGTYQEALMITGAVEGDKRGKILIHNRGDASLVQGYAEDGAGAAVGVALMPEVFFFSEAFDGTETTFKVVMVPRTNFAVNNEMSLSLIGYYTSLHILVF